jgi:predicted nuclease of predicted toxin-antitoxin system
MIARPRTFLLDENMPRKILTSLRREGFNATRVYDAELRSQPDTAIFAYARARQMTILTFDTDYLNQIAFPPPHAGILVLRSFPRETSFLYYTVLGAIVLP